MKPKVILGVTESDSHVVANHLIAYYLRAQGFDVINLGACTPLGEFISACAEHAQAEALLIGSHNGHAPHDLAGLREARRTGLINCPVILGGNLSVGAEKNAADLPTFSELGVDYILASYEEIVPLLTMLQDRATQYAMASNRIYSEFR